MSNSNTLIFLEAIDQNFEEEDYEFDPYSDSNSVESIKEKNIEKLNESFCDSLEKYIDDDISSQTSEEENLNDKNSQKRKLLLMNNFIWINEKKVNDLKQNLKNQLLCEYYCSLIH